jgi:hypothetical protein
MMSASHELHNPVGVRKYSEDGCARLAGYRPSVSYLSQAAGRIKRALRQEARLQAAHVAECQERERLGFTDGFYPESLQRLSDQFADEVYFMILAAS